MRATRFDHVHHLVTVPVVLNGAETRFILDSGIGLTLVRDTINGCAPTGASFTGKRMSGQEVTVPLGVVSSLLWSSAISPPRSPVAGIDATWRA